MWQKVPGYVPGYLIKTYLQYNAGCNTALLYTEVSRAQ